MTVNVQLRCHANDPVRHMIYYPPLPWINTPPTFIHPGRGAPPLLAACFLLQLGQLSVIPPGLVLEAGGDFNLAGSYACKVEVPPHFKVPSGGDFSSPGMAAC